MRTTLLTSSGLVAASTLTWNRKWFGAEWDWYFGVDPVTIGKDECYRLLKGPIDWKLGSSDKVGRVHDAAETWN